MKERPILFSAPMVRALLAGTKTQTRRPMRVQPHDGAEVVCDDFYPTVIAKNGDEEPGPEVFGAWWSDGEEAIRCPYGKPGERLWVREAWNTSALCRPAITEPYIYRADLGPTGVTKWAASWRPSIHMPRIACRLVLEVTVVRAERLQNISAADALAEGIVDTFGGYGLPDGSHYHAADPRISYWSLWDAINGAGSVEANPWVWVVEFRRCPDLKPNARVQPLP